MKIKFEISWYWIDLYTFFVAMCLWNHQLPVTVTLQINSVLDMYLQKQSEKSQKWKESRAGLRSALYNIWKMKNIFEKQIHLDNYMYIYINSLFQISILKHKVTINSSSYFRAWQFFVSLEFHIISLNLIFLFPDFVSIFICSLQNNLLLQFLIFITFIRHLKIIFR